MVQWTDGSTDWIALKDVKDFYPSELARYAHDQNLQDEPAFARWTKDAIRYVFGSVKPRAGPKQVTKSTMGSGSNYIRQ